MSKRNIVALPGDGIGNIVLEQAIRVLNAAGFEANYIYGDIGWEFWCNEGNPLPERTIKLLEQHKTGLFGAVTSKPKDKAEAELSNELKGKGYSYYSPIVSMRQRFKMDICMRPCRTYAGNPLNFIRRSAVGTIEEPVIDVMIFRQNTECLYGGVEWSNPDEPVYETFMSHPKFRENFGDVPKSELAISARIFTKKYTERIVRAAFEYAQKNKLKAITVCEKPNVVRETSGMMLKIAQELSKTEYKGIDVWDTNVDAMMMWLTKNPEDFNVIVAGNMFGDIISDGFAGLTGGLGFACSAQFGEEGVAVFEPTHGSAPKYADYKTSIVNPVAMIAASVMMLNHLGEIEAAQKIENAIASVVKEGKVRTYDMAKLKGSEDAISKGAATTIEMADAIISKLK